MVLCLVTLALEPDAVLKKKRNLTFLNLSEQKVRFFIVLLYDCTIERKKDIMGSRFIYFDSEYPNVYIIHTTYS